MKTIKQFINENKIRMACDWADNNPNMTDFEGNHFKLKLKKDKKTMSLYFSQGYGHTGEPQIDSVLECLQSDNLCSQDTFEDFCANCGYDEDSRKAEKIYKTFIKQNAKIKNLLGNSYNEFLNCEAL